MTAFTHWYHLFADGEWRTPVDEHLSALAKIGYDGPFRVGVVGSPDHRQEAVDHLRHYRPPDRIVQADRGFEQVTLRKVREDARKHPDGITLYCHTKGASRPSSTQDAWRRSMTCGLLGGLGVHVKTLGMVYEAVGSHWLTVEDEHEAIGHPPWPHFAGNFWLARNDFLNTLPPVPASCRHDAEGWLGVGARPPRVLDLNPGWPGTVPWLTLRGWPK